MKYIAFFAVFLIYVNLSLQLPKFVNCPEDYEPPSSMAEKCGVFTCLGPNRVAELGCATYACPPNKQLIYVNVNNSAPYPACCGNPRCTN